MKTSVNTVSRPAENPVLRKANVLDGLRAFGVMLGGSAALVGTAALCVGATAAALARGRRPHPLALAGTAGTVAYARVLHPRLMTWELSPMSRSRAFRGTSSSPTPVSTTWAGPSRRPSRKSGRGSPRSDRATGAGFYSYEWPENLAGCRMRNADVLHPKWQDREVGETVKLHWAHGLEGRASSRTGCLRWEAGTSFLSVTTGEAASSPERASRGTAAYGLLLELPHFIMERKMLLGIKPARGACPRGEADHSSNVNRDDRVEDRTSRRPKWPGTRK